MKHSSRFFRALILTTGLSCLIGSYSVAQQLLDKKLSLRLQSTPVASVLKKIAQEGGFYFSYNSNMVPGDSVVSIDVHEETVKNILHILLDDKYIYRETGNYIIIHLMPYNGHPYIISGRILSTAGNIIANASIYERFRLISDLSDSSGSFHLRLHSNSPEALIVASKAGYNDTSLTIRSGYDQTLTITLSPIRRIFLDSVTVTPYSRIEKTWMGKLFISSKQKIQDMNLSGFFVRQPFQYSLVPRIGTHGKLSAQVVNKFSLNILGGYSAGVNGFELGGLFNLDKKEVKYAQVAGLFNTVGGRMQGVQVAGLHNSVLDSVTGVQIAGINNRVTGALQGVQVAGITNYITGNFSGVMLAGIANITQKSVNGVQIAAVFNYTRNLQGLQIGLVNIADTSSGYSIGLLNITGRHGYYKLSFFADEAMSLNMALKTGDKKLYNILLVGAGPEPGLRTFAAGYGIGREFTFNHTLSPGLLNSK